MQAEPQGVDAGLGIAAPMRNGHTHGDLELNFVYGGGLRYFMGGRFVEIGAGTLSVFWGALPHQIVEVEGQDRVHVRARAAGDAAALEPR